MDSVNEIFLNEVESKIFNMKSDLMIFLRDAINESGLTQKDSAKRLDISQPRLNSLLNGDIHCFSLGMLVRLSLRFGFDVNVEVV